METKAKLFALQIDSDSDLHQILNALRNLNKNSQESTDEVAGSKELLVLGCRIHDVSCSQTVLSLSEFFIHLWRRHRLHANERQTVVSAEDQLVVVQLCQATINKEKTGDFDVDASTVMELHQTLGQDKLSEACEGGDSPPHRSEEYLQLRSTYNQFLKNCNMVDLVDVLDMVKKELTHNQDLEKDVAARDYVMVNKPQSPIEMEMLKLLVAHTETIQTVKVGMPLGESSADLSTTFVETTEASVDEAIALCEDIRPPAPSSVTESYAESVLVAYLQVLVNSRSELGLARALNVPDRELDHRAFSALKKEAKAKGLSMFQTASSFIMRLRLGGRGYAPSADNQLGLHVKGLGEFVDLLHKLQTIVEEETNCSNAVKRVINVVKNTIVKHRDNVLRRASVEQAAERLLERAAQVVTSLGSSNPYSPQRPAGIGGSMLGRDTLRVLRHLIDSHAGIAMMTRSVDLLCDAFSSQKTPLRFSCLLSKFRSPIEASPDDTINKSLAERLLEKKEDKPKVVGVPRYQATYDWARPVHDITNTRITFAEDDLQSEMVCPPKAVNPKSSGPRRILESIRDQENTERIPETNTTTVPSAPAPVPAQSRKRPAQDSVGSSSQQPKKQKQAAKKPAQKANAKKKPSALQKGQKQLTSFFRM